MTLKWLKDAVLDGQRHERHRTNAETQYWLARWKRIAEDTVRELERVNGIQEAQ